MRRRANPITIGIILVVCVLAVFIGFAFSGIDRLWSNNANEQVAAAEEAINRAAVQCYALEGSYPPKLSYLEEHYGIQLNTDKYDYFYKTFGSNIRPEVKVYIKKAETEP